MRSTFKLLFYINRNKVRSDGTTAVLCRISIDGKKSAVTTGVYCKPGDWDSKKCEIKTARENNRLTAFRGRLEEAYGNLLRNQGVVTAELLKTTVSGANSVPEYLLQAGEVERERLPRVHDRVPRVVATLVAHHQPSALGEHVDQFALAFVAPLGTDQHSCRVHGVALSLQGW